MSANEASGTARERLLWQLRNPGLVGLDEYDATELIDNFAGELAAEIEAERDSMIAEGTGGRDYLYGMSYAATLVDPVIGEPWTHPDDRQRT